MAIAEMLDELKQKALHDPKLKEALLATRKEDQPFAAFCRKCRELGYEPQVSLAEGMAEAVEGYRREGWL